MEMIDDGTDRERHKKKAEEEVEQGKDDKHYKQHTPQGITTTCYSICHNHERQLERNDDLKRKCPVPGLQLQQLLLILISPLIVPIASTGVCEAAFACTCFFLLDPKKFMGPQWLCRGGRGTWGGVFLQVKSML
jgi:hypothetical protein